MPTPLIIKRQTHWEIQAETKPVLKHFDFRWDQISAFGKSRLIKSFTLWFILVPFLVKFFEVIPEDISFNFLGEIFTLNLRSPLPDQIYLFYFASFCFAVGNLVYVFKCPEIVKSYSGYSDFKEHDGSSEKVVTAMENFGFHKDVGDEIADLVVSDLISKYCRDLDKTSAFRQNIWHQKLSRSVFPDAELPNIFSYVRNASNYLSRTSRQLCSVFYALGISFIAFILLSNFIVVVSAFLDSF